MQTNEKRGKISATLQPRRNRDEGRDRPRERQSSHRRALPARRHHITQKVKIAGQPIFYIGVHDAPCEKLGDLLAEAKYVTSIDHPSLLTASKHLQRGGLT